MTTNPTNPANGKSILEGEWAVLVDRNSVYVLRTFYDPIIRGRRFVWVERNGPGVVDGGEPVKEVWARR